MQCPHCGYVLSAFDKICPRCGKSPTTKPTPVNVPATPPAHSPVPTNAVPGVPPATPNGPHLVPPVPQSIPSPSDVSNAFGSFLSTLGGFLRGQKRILPLGIGVALVLASGTYFVLHHHGPNYYANKLHLATLPQPEVLAPIPAQDSPRIRQAISEINNISTTAEADAGLLKVEMGRSLGRSFISGATQLSEADKQKGEQRLSNYVNCVEQAIQIKRQQIIEGDTTDSTGELKQRIDMIRQYLANGPVVKSVL